MSFTHGKNSTATINSVPLTQWLDGIEWKDNVDVADTSHLGADEKTFLEGQSVASFSLSGIFDAAAGGPRATLSGLKGGGAVTFSLSEDGTATIAGSAILTSYTESAKVGDAVKFAADFQVSGAVSYS